MTHVIELRGKFPKSARLRKRHEFRFADFSIFKGGYFNFVFAAGEGTRLGVSISKKILKKAVWRNRVKRLIREVFRFKVGQLSGFHVHVVALTTLTGHWRELTKFSVEKEFEEFLGRLVWARTRKPLRDG